MVDVNGKWAFITGASRGLGKLAAIALAEKGCNLILHARKKSHLDELEAKLSNVEIIKVEGELSSEADILKLIDDVDNLNKNIEIIINNAGLQIAYRTDFYVTPINDYTVSFMINTIAPMMICYRFLPKMVINGFGRIINVTSGIDKEPEQAGYSAAKAALDKVTKDIATRVEGTDVMINLTDPGWCRTDLGGPKAPNAPEDAFPGFIVPVFLDDKKSGRIFRCQDYKGMTLKEAVESVK